MQHGYRLINDMRLFRLDARPYALDVNIDYLFFGLLV
jgi:hypothetical protein